ncbi:helix-turn-helix domain-containing protein [Marinomonas mediterranea]|jgi:hypothetical protein|uniref:Transcriptional regulator n=1 Tax=Marinomonas mediterranea (strain ATCC 700492 / JCM 21426 / NBRC 103028 / MMB-1) TaxID=717774 RepID=F2JY73_MARM1|nr:helix-turn-helix transcriptional regulator [Marinomonas mediterranea]ADZ90809.1 transcriptional regulator [Marinomonas mediterranea MMB-1]WCN08849.1 helix-turn-helix domain-containing protein [Marinomonas mediterranea]WCN12894.1 helix-turn-helix domain-containing protein [Marinomonas mediterranea]WCN16962.1 helix-turn-helix domain-containing protein [Marinomonas mediterranea MMB-1]
MNLDFQNNLRLLCSYYKSIAEVCRRLQINRPQFNRYLNGKTVPADSTMRRICDFFGVTQSEMLLPHNQFQRLVQARPINQDTSVSERSIEQTHFDRLNHVGQKDLDKYCGYYFEYYISMSCPGQILRTLVHIESQDGKTYYQRIERFNPKTSKKPFHGIYQGVVQFLSDRLFLMDYEAHTKVEVTQTILYPSFKNRVERLKGLRLGVSGSGERVPCCVRVVYEYLGKSLDRKKALSMSGLYDMASNEIDDDIKEAIRNDIDEGEWHFRGRF